ncbi:sulfotransferase [Pseudoalteromonas sp. SSDWG2]|uniref:sulfotransferase n=1 Tax=Pseudoalteromonas sp. SSDWG2 TaxID=3139391 RepID=UPI003BAAC594
MTQYHFISGLPRSGSTLLAGLLRQNPALHGAMSSPVASLMALCLEHIAPSSEFGPFFDAQKRRRLCHAIFSSYYQNHVDKTIIFDTNRAWTARLHQLVELFDDFKMICCVRNPASIMDSFECIYRKNPFDYGRIYSPQTRHTVYTRCESLANYQGAFGGAWTALKEAYYGEYSDRLLLLDYDLLTQHPARSMELLYQFLGVPSFDHDFNNVVYEEGEFDSNIGVKGLHTVKRQVTHTPRRSILPPELFNKYSEMAFWHDTNGTRAHFICAKSGQGDNYGSF